MTVASVDDVRAIVARELDVTVLEVRRQTRWRPTWFVDAEKGGLRHDLVVRGDRVDTQAYPLKHEMAFHRILHDNGVKVPELYAYLPELDALILEFVPGKPDFGGVPEADRDVIVDEYLQELVKVHQLPIEPFTEAGIMRAGAGEDPALVHRSRMIATWRAKKAAPDPFTEFCLGWMHRHPPRSDGRETPIICDTGQFHHDRGHLTAVLDLEFGHIGDPLIDLAVWRMRDTLIPFGDFAKLYARYEELSGTIVDLEMIKRHTFASTLGNQLMFGPAVTDPVSDTDLMNNMQWNSETNLHATETLAELLDIELPTVTAPEPRTTRQDKTFAHLVESLKVDTDDYLLKHDLRLAFRMARHLQRAHEIGDQVIEDDLDDLHALLGQRPATFSEGDAALEEFVLADAAEGRHDEALIKLFHRRNLRVHLQLGPPGSSMATHLPMRAFPRSRRSTI